ncbi:MAG: NTP/NDP exchange transporter [Myxococcota bacterium]
MPTEAQQQRHPLKQFSAALREHGALALLMFLYFFLVIATFWILKPLKNAFFLTYYDEEGIELLGWHLSAAQADQLAKVLNMFVAIVAVTVFTKLARKLEREQLTYVFSGLFGVLFGIYAIAMRDPGDAVVWTFYLLGDLWTTIMVATFFAFLNDSFAPGAAKRLYSVVVLGGVAGGAFGSTVLRTFVETISRETWLWICLGSAGVIVVIAGAAGRLVRRNPPPAEGVRTAEVPEGSKGSAALEGARLVFKSRYLLAIVALLGMYELVSSILDFQWKAATNHYLDGDAIGEHIATVYSVTNVVSLVVQIVVTTWVMNHFRLKVALLVTPAIILMSSGAFLAVPVLWLGGMLTVSDNAFNYSINQSARETLYTPTSRDEKYKAKAFIDMFVQRFAKVLAVGVNLVVTMFVAQSFLGVRLLSLISIGLLVVWVLAARYAGEQFGNLVEREATHGDVR